jgi:hypothetical protein
MARSISRSTESPIVSSGARLDQIHLKKSRQLGLCGKWLQGPWPVHGTGSAQFLRIDRILLASHRLTGGI